MSRSAALMEVELVEANFQLDDLLEVNISAKRLQSLITTLISAVNKTATKANDNSAKVVTLNADARELQGEVNALRRSNDMLKKQVTNLDEEVVQQKRVNQEVGQSLEDLKGRDAEQLETIEKLRRVVTSQGEELEQVRRQNDALKHKDGELQEEIESLKKLLKGFTTKDTEQQEEIDTLKRLLDQLGRKDHDRQGEMDAIRRLLETLQQKDADQQDVIDMLKKTIEAVSRDNADQGDALRRLSDATTRKNTEFGEEFARIKKAMEVLQRRSQEQETEIGDSRANLEVLTRRAREIGDEVDAHKRFTSTLQRKDNEQQDDIEELKRHVEMLHKLEGEDRDAINDTKVVVDALRVQMQAAADDITRVTGVVDTLHLKIPDLYDKFHVQDSRFEDLRRRDGEQQQEIDTVQRMLEAAQRKLGDHGDDLVQLRSLADNIRTSLGEEIRALRSILDALRGEWTPQFTSYSESLEQVKKWLDVLQRRDTELGEGLDALRQGLETGLRTTEVDNLYRVMEMSVTEVASVVAGDYSVNRLQYMHSLPMFRFLSFVMSRLEKTEMARKASEVQIELQRTESPAASIDRLPYSDMYAGMPSWGGGLRM